jgi:hypothetical protein
MPPILQDAKTRQRPELKKTSSTAAHIQKLLGSVEIARCVKRHTGTQLVVRQRTIR